MQQNYRRVFADYLGDPCKAICPVSVCLCVRTITLTMNFEGKGRGSKFAVTGRKIGRFDLECDLYSYWSITAHYRKAYAVHNASAHAHTTSAA